MATTVTEIAPDLFRISTFIPEINLQFGQFLVRDDEPLLFETGLKQLFPEVRAAVASLIPPERLRWIGFSHFEQDECGSLNEWLTLAPAATPVCSFVAAMVSVNDFAIRPAHALMDGETLATGRQRFRLLHTPHLPHCWEASHLFEETDRTLLCSDLFTHTGDVEPMTEGDIVGRARETLLGYQAGPFAHYMPWTAETAERFERLAALAPARLATMHGSTYVGDGARALRDLATATREALTTP